MIHRLLGPIRPRTRIIVFGKPASVKQAYLNALPILWLMLFMTPLLCGFGPPRLVDREVAPTVRISVGELRSWAEQSTLPDLSAESFLLYDMGSDRTIFAHNSATARAPASLTKLMTALLVLEHADLDDVVTVEAQDMAEGATMGLRVGDVVSVQDLLWGLLLPSGNDAANTLARHVGGSVEEFVRMMNARSQTLGLQQTHFVNPHGLDATGHVSSAEDMLQLTRALWTYPVFRTMVGTARVAWNGRDLLTTNEWLATYDGVTGVKTGTTDNAGECLIASVERNGRTVLLVIMGSSRRYQDAATLYETFRAHYAWATADGAELSVFNRVYDDEGQVLFLQPTGVAPTVLQRNVGAARLRSYRRLQLPEDALPAPGTQVGILEWWAGDDRVGTQPLVVR